MLSNDDSGSSIWGCTEFALIVKVPGASICRSEAQQRRCIHVDHVDNHFIAVSAFRTVTTTVPRVATCEGTVLHHVLCMDRLHDLNCYRYHRHFQVHAITAPFTI
jgi:hypothetical protein